MTSPNTNHQTHMTKPPGDQTQMTNPPEQSKMVKIKTLRPIRLNSGNTEEQIVPEGRTIAVTEAQAKAFCDQDFDIGHKGSGFGHLPNPATLKVRRAERV